MELGEIVYDIQFSNGEILKGCYFILYQKNVTNGYGDISMTVPDNLKCFVNGEEVKDKNFNDFKVLKLYDPVRNRDYTNDNLGVPFPIVRKKVTIE
jgi:hypothetical protein